jgi:hypothetical protein
MRTGGPGRSRTADLRFRKPSLYPSELRGPCGCDPIFSHWFAVLEQAVRVVLSG